MEARNFLHNGSIGDVWASIPAMRQHFVNTGAKVNLYLDKDVPATYYEGAVHPTKDDNGGNVMLNQKVIDMMIPLLKEQDFINEVKLWEGEEIKVQLPWFRETFVGMPSFSINRWYFYIYPELTCDLSGVWLNVPDSEKDLAKNKIIITRSERYTITGLDFSFLKPYEDECLFVGTMREYNNFCMTFDLNIRKLHIDNFLDLAQAIKQCKFHITNQTQAFQLSEGQKIPRLLELCPYAPNCIPIGANAYDYLHQFGLEAGFHRLNGTFALHLEKVRMNEENKKAALIEENGQIS